MPKALDLTNQRFGKLTALYRTQNKGKKTYWQCICDCGNEKDIQTCHLTNGFTTSCGNCNNQDISDNFIKNFSEREQKCLICEENFINKHPNRKFCYNCVPGNTTPNKRAFYKQKALKHQLVMYKGGCCENCGYSKYEGALEFHHIDPTQKDFSISQMTFNGTIYNLDYFKKEVDKCRLLCANCHREEHNRINMEKNLEEEEYNLI